MKKSLLVASILSLFAVASFAQAPTAAPKKEQAKHAHKHQIKTQPAHKHHQPAATK